jgi:hypothetical protein
VGPRAGMGDSEDIKYLTSAGLQTPDSPARKLVTISTTLSRLPNFR